MVAKGDIDISSTTRSTRTKTGAGASSASSANTTLDRVAGLYVTGSRSSSSNSGADGQLLVLAGNDLSARGAQVLSAGSATLYAGNNLSLGTVGESSELNINLSGKGGSGAIHQHQSREVGSAVSAVGDVTLVAGNDLALRAAQVHSQSGALIASAGNDLRIEAGQASASSDSRIHVESRSTMSRSVKDIRNTQSSTSAQASDLSGNNVTLVAGQDISVEGSHVNAQDKLLVNAGRDVNILAAQEQSSESQFYSEKNKGFSGSFKTGFSYGKSSAMQNGTVQSTSAAGSTLSGGSVRVDSGRDTTVQGSTVVADQDIDIHAKRNLSILAQEQTQSTHSESRSKSTGIGLTPSSTGRFTSYSKTSNEDTGNGTSTSQSGSQVVSLGGNVNLSAGGTYRQSASDVMALGQGSADAGNIDIRARSVQIEAAHNTGQQSSQSKSKSISLGSTASVGGIDLNTLGDSLRTGVQNIGKTKNARIKALGVINTALDASALGGKVADLGQTLAQGGTPGFKIGVSLGKSQSQSSSTSNSSQAQGSRILGAGNVSISATGGGTESNLNAIGATIEAGDTLRLHADNAINLSASQDNNSYQSKNSSSGFNVGVSYAMGSQNGFTLELGANKAKGRGNGTELIHNNTHVSAGQEVQLSSGGDTNLRGTVVSAPRVTADVGGNLNIESLQDKAEQQSKQSSGGFGVSLCVPPFCIGASSFSGSAASAKANSSYASVGEQSGIRAGDGGFDVQVKGHTDLKGGVISSSQVAIDEGKNSLSTGSLSSSDIENHSRSSASGYSVSGGYSFAAGDQSAQTMAENGSSDRDRAAAADAIKNTGPTGNSLGVGSDSVSQSSTTRAGISGIAGDTSVRTSDVSSTIALVRPRDANAALADVQAQSQITGQFGATASSAWGKYANDRFVEAVLSGDQEAAERWGPTGSYRAGGHAAIGALTGGAPGALGAGASSLTAPEFVAFLRANDVPEPLVAALGTAAAGTLGAVVGGTAGASAAFNEAGNNAALAAPLIFEGLMAAGRVALVACARSPACVGVIGAATLNALGVNATDASDAAAGTQGTGAKPADTFGAGSDGRTRGLPPEGVKPPVGEVQEGPASRPSERDKGGKSLWDSNGGEWRYSPEDKWHNPHWDYNPHDKPSSPWQNVPIDQLPPRK